MNHVEFVDGLDGDPQCNCNFFKNNLKINVFKINLNYLTNQGRLLK